MHNDLTLQVKQTAAGWYLIRVAHGVAAHVADELVRVPGCTVIDGDGYVDIKVPENALSVVAAELDEAGIDWVLAYPTPPAEVSIAEPARLLYPHQLEAVHWLLSRGGGLLADDMGLGKTSSAAVAVESYAQANAPARLRLIVGPGNVEAVWRRELAALGYISDPSQMAAASGTQSYERNLRGNLDSRWLFVPYHLMDKWLHFARLNRCGGACAVIVDEAHWAKNPRSERGRATRTASTLTNFRVLLTGTPMANRTSELWNVLTALDGTGAWGSQFDFRLRYCGAVHDGHGYQDMGPTYTDELKNRMGHRYLRRTAKSAGLKLPPFRREAFEVEPTPKEFEAYEALGAKIGPDKMRALIESVRSGQFGRDTLETMTKLRKFTSRVKARATSELVAECLEQGQSVVVFTWERAMAEKLARAAFAGPSYLVTGAIPQADREQAISDFQNVGGALFATLDSIKEGVTLTRASRLILHDQSWVPSDLLQAEARINRIGQDQPVLATWMLMAHSFDSILVETLTRKVAEIEKVLDIGDGARALEVVGSGFATAALNAENLLANWARPLTTQGTP